MGMDGDFGGVTIVLGNLEEHSEAVLVAMGISVLGDIATKYRGAKNWWDEVLR